MVTNMNNNTKIKCEHGVPSMTRQLSSLCYTEAKDIPSNLSLPNSTTDSISMLADTALDSATSTQ